MCMCCREIVRIVGKVFMHLMTPTKPTFLNMCVKYMGVFVRVLFRYKKVDYIIHDS